MFINHVFAIWAINSEVNVFDFYPYLVSYSSKLKIVNVDE